MNRIILKASIVLLLLAFGVMPATAQISPGAPRNTINAGWSLKHFIAFDGTNYLVVWDQWPNVKGVFVDGNSNPIGTPFMIAAADPGTELGYSRVTFGGGKFLVTYAVNNGGANPKMAMLVGYSAGGVPQLSQAHLVTYVGAEISWAENSESIWDEAAQKFIINWKVGPTSSPSYPLVGTALRFMDLDGRLGPVQFMSDLADDETNATLACNSTVCLAVGYAYGIPFLSEHPNLMSVTWARLFKADTLEPLTAVFYMDDLSGLMEDQRVVFDAAASMFHVVWIRGRAYVDFRNVDTLGRPGVLDLTKSVGPRWGQLGFRYNEGTHTTLLAGTSPVPGSDYQDLRAFEVGSNGYPRDLNNMLILSDQSSDRQAMEYNPHIAADDSTGQWMVIYTGKYAGRVIGVQGNATPHLSVTGVSPAAGPIGGTTAATVTGTNFQATSTVTFGGASATITSWSSTQLHVTTPPHAAGAVDVIVQNSPTETATLTSAFTYFVPATLSVTIVGSGTVTAGAGGSCSSGTCSVVLPVNTAVTLSAAPAAGYIFAGWSGNADCLDGILSMSGDTACTATFIRDRTTDFNADNSADILWRNRTNGQIIVWYMSGVSYAGYATIACSLDSTWSIGAVADFNADGRPDLVWRNNLTGENQMWLNNGDGTFTATALPSLVDFNTRIVAAADLNGDGRPDIVFRNAASGQNSVWFMDGPTRLSTASLPAVSDANWRIVGATDFNSDGKADLLWRNVKTGEDIVWYMNGTSFVSWVSLPTVADTHWTIAGTWDFDGNGKPDIVWRNTSTGDNLIWLLNNASYVGYATLPKVADSTWDIIKTPEIASAGPTDMNADGSPDIVWRNTATGANRIWYMGGSTKLLEAAVDPMADLGWQIVGVADFNNDGAPDIVWRNPTTGANIVWYMHGEVYGNYATLPAVADANWQIVAVADFNGDGKPDLVWRNSSTGASIVWYMNGAAYAGYATLPSMTDTNWKIVAAADFNGDGKPDLLWHNDATGDTVIWFMNGATYAGYAAILPTIADVNWQPVSAADYNGDGHPDVLWRNRSTGVNIIWYLNGTTYLWYATVASETDTNWKIVGR